MTAARERQSWATLRGNRLWGSRDEDGAGVDDGADEDAGGLGTDPAAAKFADGVYATPSAYIARLVAELPEDQRLTRDQTLFVATFAKACDEAWEDDA